jgi:hypothetical protein
VAILLLRVGFRQLAAGAIGRVGLWEPGAGQVLGRLPEGKSCSSECWDHAKPVQVWVFLVHVAVFDGVFGAKTLLGKLENWTLLKIKSGH